MNFVGIRQEIGQRAEEAAGWVAGRASDAWKSTEQFRGDAGKWIRERFENLSTGIESIGQKLGLDQLKDIFETKAHIAQDVLGAAEDAVTEDSRTSLMAAGAALIHEVKALGPLQGCLIGGMVNVAENVMAIAGNLDNPGLLVASYLLPFGLRLAGIRNVSPLDVGAALRVWSKRREYRDNFVDSYQQRQAARTP